MKNLSFSQRMGFTEVKSKIQLESIDKIFLNDLWNNYYEFFLKDFTGFVEDIPNSDVFLNLHINTWKYYFNYNIDSFPSYTNDYRINLKRIFFEQTWYKTYNFLEFTAKHFKSSLIFKDFCNDIFKEHLSGYRFVDEQIVPISSELEIESIEESLNFKGQYKNVSAHFKSALELLSNKENPDYRNSIKESISAIETVCKVIVGDSSTTLGFALKKIQKDNPELNRLFKSSIEKLYAYTNDGNGIRHSLMEDENVGQDEAIFMLISCSAFSNYLIKKIKT